MRKPGALGTLAVVLACVGLGSAAQAQARDAVVSSFDGTPIIAHFFPGDGVSDAKPAPTIMVGPGWSQPGETDPEGGSISDFIDAGYNVLTWDPRGFGGSGGTVMIDSPDFEGRDAQALIDFIAEQPEAQLDAPGDPRLGMSGGSYGGGIQIVTAALDRRVDVIAPTISWNSLITSLFKSGKIKLGWGLALSGLGVPFSVAPGIFSPAGAQAGHQSPQFYSTFVDGASTGTVSDANRQWFAEHGPDYLLPRIKVPTLLIEGTVDTLFTLDEADRNYHALEKQGIPLKLIFFCGGHGVCLTKSDSDSAALGDSARAQQRRLEWFDRYLRGKAKVDTGPAFEWIDEDAGWHSSAQYPPQTTSTLSGTGSGQLPLTPGTTPPPGSGVAVFGTPQPVSIKAEVSSPAGLDVVGEPQLTMTYTGTAAPAQTYVFAQLVDPSRNVVVGNQVTPIPVTLDGAEHTMEIPLERIASVSTASGYELQLISASTVYDIQRSAGLIDVSSAKLSLPVTQPYAQPSDACLRYPFGTGAADRLLGSDGRDCLRGRGGNDRIDSGAGDDDLRGGRGRDRIKAGDGDDVIHVALGSRDRVDCGPGDDTVFASAKKDRWRNCEKVRRR
jgi:ABC-2 type transport system ATP-binding protein